MSLERQDVRAKLDADLHAELVDICESRGITIAEFIEDLVVPEIRRLIHEHNVLAEKRARRGITGKNRE